MNIKFCITVYLVLLTLLLAGCESVYFTQPQPTNAKNLKFIPKKYHGTWYMEDDSVWITRSSFIRHLWNEHMISMSELDTSKDLFIENNLLYIRSMDSTIGHPFEVRNDSIHVRLQDLTEYWGDSTAVRKAKHKFHTYNVYRPDLGWEMYLLNRSKNGDIVVRYPSKEMVDPLLNDQPSSEDSMTSTVNFTKKTLSQFMDAGGFENVVLHLEVQFKQR